MESLSALLAFCAGNSVVTGEFSAQRPVTRSFDVFLDLRLNKRLNKQWWGWWFGTPSRKFWRYCNDVLCGWLHSVTKFHTIKKIKKKWCGLYKTCHEISPRNFVKTSLTVIFLMHEPFSEWHGWYECHEDVITWIRIRLTGSLSWELTGYFLIEKSLYPISYKPWCGL